MKILIIGYVWPEPNSSAAGRRMLELIELFLSQHWEIIFASAALLSNHRVNLSALGVQEQSILLNDGSFDTFIEELKPDAVLFDRFFSEEQFGWRVEKVCPEALRILDTEDLHSLRYARYKILRDNQKNIGGETARHNTDPVMADAAVLYSYMSDDDMSKREVAAIFRCDLTLMISRFEIDLLKQYFSVPEYILQYCPFLKKRSPEQFLPDYGVRQHFISIGNFRHEPNWDAVLYLKHAIWPKIFAQLPQSQLLIYGAYPPPKATQLHTPKEGFYVKGWADDVHLLMQQMRVCLAPLRFGAGIKGKLMDAMYNGTPSVTTAIGAEAMHGNLPWGGAVENDAQAIADAAVQLYINKSFWEESQQNGFDVLENYLNAEDYMRLLIDRIAQLRSGLDSERRKNFVGAMLRHHSLKSTQYMAQWIEAKNKHA